MQNGQIILCAINAQKLLSRDNSKLCFSAQKMLFVPENKLAPSLMSGVIASKVGNRSGIKY
jgi:hypothetical protein